MGDQTAIMGGRVKLAGAMLLGTVASGALVVGSLNGLGVANASCVNISGFGIGDGCQASFGSVAIVLGPTGDVENASEAIAGNPDGEGGFAFSPLNFALALGSANDGGTVAWAGVDVTAGAIPNIANVTFAGAGTHAVSFGVLNLAGSFGGQEADLTAGGVGNSALNLGANNALVAVGVVNNATSLFGNGNIVVSGNIPAGDGLAALFPPGLNVAFNILGNENTVQSGIYGQTADDQTDGDLTDDQGPLAITGAIGVDGQGGGATSPPNGLAVNNSNFGITLRNPFNVQDEVTPGLTASKNVARTGSKSVTKPGSQLSSSLKKVNANAKAFNEKVKKAFSGLKNKKTASADD